MVDNGSTSFSLPNTGEGSPTEPEDTPKGAPSPPMPLILCQFLNLSQRYGSRSLDLNTEDDTIFFTKDILKIQNQIIAEYRARLSFEDEQIAFDRIVADSRGSRQMHDNGRIIKNLLKIENLKQFMSDLVQATCGARHNVKFTEDGKIRINDQLLIHADTFSQMSVENKAVAMRATREFAVDQDIAKFLSEIKVVCQTERIKFEIQRELVVQKMAEALGVEDLGRIKIGGKEIFRDLRPVEKDRLYEVMKAARNEIDPKVAKIALKLAESQKCKKSGEYCSMLEFATCHISKLKQDAKLQPNQSWNQWKTELLENLQNSTSAKFRDMNIKFNELEATLSQINELSPFQFKCKKALTYHFYKHNGFQHGVVNEQEYFSILNTLFEAEVNRSQTSMTQEGDKVRIIYTDSEKGLFGVLERPRHMSGTSGVCVGTMYYNQDLIRR